MARVVVLGAGVSGHTAALHLRRKLSREHTVTVVSPNSHWNWIPSNIWVGVGDMTEAEADATGAVDLVHTSKARGGDEERIRYDYLINATGPKLKFEATSGLGPDGGNSVSVCTASHAVEAAEHLAASIERMRRGEEQTLVVGVGHGTCTCEGAAFEYAFNVDHELRKAGVRDKARLIYLTNEATLGDFGVGGMTFVEQGFQQSSTSRCCCRRSAARASRPMTATARTSPTSCSRRRGS